MAGPLRVVFLTLYYPPLYSGAALQAISLIRALRAHGVEITVVTAYPGPPPSGGDEAAGAGVRVVRVRTPRSTHARQLVLGARAAWRLLRSSDWDVLHLIGPSYAALLPACVARVRGRPVLTKTTLLAADGGRAANPGVPLLRRVRRWIYRMSGAVVALSDALERQVREEAGDGVRIAKLPNGVDLDFFRPGSPAERKEARRTFSIADDAFAIACCGEIHRRKRAAVVVAAAGRMRHQPTHVVLAGPSGNDPDYDRELEQAIAACPQGVAVSRTGTVPPERIAELLRAADAFVLASRSEGMPNSLLEAMASGVASVASDIPGSRDVLQHGGGRLFPLDDVDGLAQVLDGLAGDAARREQLATEGRAVVAERFSLESVAARYLALYRELTGPPRGAPRPA
jgi:glycosyltransferase involved in cell wall biosynthesis